MNNKIKYIIMGLILLAMIGSVNAENEWLEEWTGHDTEAGEFITTPELQDAIYHWLEDIPVRGHLMTTADLQLVISIWMTY